MIDRHAAASCPSSRRRFSWSSVVVGAAVSLAVSCGVIARAVVVGSPEGGWFYPYAQPATLAMLGVWLIYGAGAAATLVIPWRPADPSATPREKRPSGSSSTNRRSRPTHARHGRFSHSRRADIISCTPYRRARRGALRRFTICRTPFSCPSPDSTRSGGPDRRCGSTDCGPRRRSLAMATGDRARHDESD